MIPKRIFFYWGNRTMSWMRYMTLWSFRKFNPDWEMVLYFGNNNLDDKTWVEHNEQDFHSFEGVDYSDRIAELNIKVIGWELKDNQTVKDYQPIKMGSSHISNYLKWSKLHEEGGIYSDLDILYFRPMDEFYHNLRYFDTAICQTAYISIGLLASRPDNDFFKDIFIQAMKKINISQYQSAGVNSVYALYGEGTNVLETAKLKYPHLKFYNIPMDLIYHFGWNQVDNCIKNAFAIEDFPEISIGYHWYAGAPEIQKYNNLLNEDNYKDFEITFTKIAGEILWT